MSALVRPILLPGAHALRHLEDAVREALVPWCRDWLLDTDMPLPLAARPVRSADWQAGDFTEWLGATGRVWVAASADRVAALASNVLGDATDDGADAWSEAVLREAAADLERRVAESLVGPTVSSSRRVPDVALQGFGSGAVTFEAPGIGLLAIADEGALRGVPPPLRPTVARPPKAPLDLAARNASVRLTVDLGDIELDVARLLELEPGDVLRLPTAVSERLTVRLGDHAVATGALCHRGGHKAIQLHPIRPQHRAQP